MSSIRTILAATDFSPDAEHAARRAAILAAQHGARMLLLHVVEPDLQLALRDWIAQDRDLRGAVAEQAKMQLDACADDMERQHGVAIERLVRLGRSIDEVREASIECDLVVVGARGAQGVREATLGTFADRLVRTAQRPVLVVKRPPEGAYRCALVLTDFSAGAEAALGATLAVTRDAAVHLLHAFAVPFEGKLRLAGVRDEDIASNRNEVRGRALTQMQQAVAGLGPDRVATEVVPGDVRTAAWRTMDRLRPDLLAVGKHGDSLLQDMLLGSTTGYMLALAGCDVLVVPRRAAQA